MFNDPGERATGGGGDSDGLCILKVTIGLHGSADNYSRAFAVPVFRISDDARTALAAIPYETAERLISWAVVTPRMVGLSMGGSYEEFMTAALRAGWAQLPAEAAPAIRLQHWHRAAGRCLLVASDLIFLGNEAHLFSVCADEDGPSRLGLPGCRPSMHYDADQPFAVMQVTGQ